MLQESRDKAEKLGKIVKEHLLSFYNYIDNREIPNLFETNEHAQVQIKLDDLAENLIINFSVSTSGIDDVEDEMHGTVIAFFPQEDFTPEVDGVELPFSIKGAPFLGSCCYEHLVAGKSFQEGIEVLVMFAIENAENMVSELMGLDPI